MQLLLRDAKSTLKALDVELSGAAEERNDAHVELPTGALESARDGLHAA